MAAGTYKCVSYTFSQYDGGSNSGTGYNLIVEDGNAYHSDQGEAPGHMVFTDDTHFSFQGGFLDGESGDYQPGSAGHIDYHPADNSGRFGCYP